MSTDDVLDQIANAVAVTTVFGPAHTHDGITVIPTATARGGGGGGGAPRNGYDSGEGGGFGLIARPSGAVVINGDTVTWKAPPVDLTRIILGGYLVAIAYFLFAWLTTRAANH